MDNQYDTGQNNGPWWSNIFLKLLTMPDGMIIFFAIVFLGVILGIIPSALTNKLELLNQKDDQIMQQHAAIKIQVDSLSVAAASNSETQIKLLRSLCLILASNKQQQLDYCNP